MEFLTKIVVFGSGVDNMYESTATREELIQRLGDYELLGLSPKQINDRWKSGGWWIQRYEDQYICSNCKEKSTSMTTFCPHCGCEMNAPMQIETNVDAVTSDYVEAKLNKNIVRIAVDGDGNCVDYALYQDDRIVEVPANWKVHKNHCCIIHGCKYGDEDCPVTLGKVKQEYLCYDCTDGYFDKKTTWAEIHQRYREWRNLDDHNTED